MEIRNFLKDFTYLFLERGEGRKKERERNMSVWLSLMHLLLGTWPTTPACALTGNQAGHPLVLRPALNPLSHSSQGMEIDLGDEYNFHDSLLVIMLVIPCVLQQQQ